MSIKFLKIINILVTLFFLYIFIKTRVIKRTNLNNNYYLEYVNGDLYNYFIFENFKDTSIVLDRSDIIDVSGIFVNENYIFLFDEKTNYYQLNKEKLEFKLLKPNEIVLLKNKKCIVEEINFKSPFWFLVFN